MTLRQDSAQAVKRTIRDKRVGERNVEVEEGCEGGEENESMGLFVTSYFFVPVYMDQSAGCMLRKRTCFVLRYP